jgi:hypothetical protein
VVCWVDGFFFVLKVVYAESLVGEAASSSGSEIQAEAKAGGCLRPNIFTPTTGAEMLIFRFYFHSYFWFICHLEFFLYSFWSILFEVLQYSPSKRSSISFCPRVVK